MKTNETFIDYEHKFWYAERYFNTLKLEEYFESDEEYTKFKAFLNVRCYLYPIPFMTMHNLFILHYVFNDFKIAINYHLSKFIPGENLQPTEMQKLA